MKKLFLYAALSLLLASCRFDSKSTSEKNTAPVQSNHENKRECFSSVIKQDSLWARLDFSADEVTGILIYDFYEKDQNKGTLHGTLKGDTLRASYTFHSEGKVSVREVAFLVRENRLIEGFGEMEMNKNQQVFKEKENIDFSQGVEFKKIDCAAYKTKFSIE